MGKHPRPVQVLVELAVAASPVPMPEHKRGQEKPAQNTTFSTQARILLCGVENFPKSAVIDSKEYSNAWDWGGHGTTASFRWPGR